jgi:hypothetical protein
LVELGVAILRSGPNHWRWLAIVGQRAISRAGLDYSCGHSNT